MKSLFWPAGSDQPGLFISERCESLWATLPYCILDDRNPEGMIKDVTDHSADAKQYILTTANEGTHTYRTEIKGGLHPLMWPKERLPRRYVSGVRTYGRMQRGEGVDDGSW